MWMYHFQTDVSNNTTYTTLTSSQVCLTFYTTAFALQEIFIRIVAPEVLNSLRTDFTHQSWFLLLYATVYLNMYAAEGKSPPLGFWYPSRHIDIQNSLFSRHKRHSKKGRTLEKNLSPGSWTKIGQCCCLAGRKARFKEYLWNCDARAATAIVHTGTMNSIQFQYRFAAVLSRVGV